MTSPIEKLPPPRPAAQRVDALMRDAVGFVAARAGAQPPLRLDVRSVDDRHIAGLPPHVGGAAPLDAETATILLGDRWTDGIASGVGRLQRQPFNTWQASDRRAFLYHVKDVLHEASHIVDGAYGAAWLDRFRAMGKTTAAGMSGEKAIEEGIAELAAFDALPEFAESRFGVEATADDIEHVRQNGSYGQQFGVMRLLRMTGAATPADVARRAIHLADGVPLAERLPRLAQMIAASDGTAAHGEVDEVMRLLPRYANGDRHAIEKLEAQYLQPR